VVNPIDLVCTRLHHQSSLQAHGQAVARYAGPLDCALQMVRADGVACLHRGLAANLVRIVPHTIITFTLVEAMRGHLGGWGAASHRDAPPTETAVRATRPSRLRPFPTATAQLAAWGQHSIGFGEERVGLFF